MGLWGILCFLIFLGISLGQEQTYVISAPKVFRVGASENFVIQAYGYTEVFDATISIKSYPDKNINYASGYVTLSTENKFQNSSILTVQPKQLSQGQKPASHVYLEVVSKHFSKSKKMPVTYDNGFLFIHTDKPVYTPHQSVKVRVYSLNDDLKPAKRETVLTFIDPEGSEVDMVEENDYTGIISFPDFKIPSNPKYGVWTIKAKYKEDFSTSGTAYFEVKEYVLPHFSVSVEPEKSFIGYKDFNDFEITIKARYFYGKVVTAADVFISFGIKEDLQDDHKEMMLKAMQNRMLINGIAKVTFNSETAIKELSYGSLEELNNKYLYIGVTVIESSGGFSEDAEVPGIKYLLSPYKLNLVATPLFLKPGIPYSIKAQVKDSFDEVIGGIPVTLNAQTVDENQERADLNSMKSVTGSTDGVASFVVNLPSGVTALEFTVTTDDPDLLEENQASKDYRAIAYSSLSRSYLYIDWTGTYKPLLVGEHLNVIVTPRSPYIDKITHYNYLILSKGKIVHFGTREKLPDSSYQSINIPVTQNMVPSARLLVYYIVTGEQTAELVSDSVWLNIEEKCGNQVQVSLFPSADMYSPGKQVTLNMATESDSWVALAAVDSAVYGVQSKAKKPLERVFQTLEKSDLGCGAGGGRNNADVFHLAGLTFLTNANADDTQENDAPCKEILRPRRMLQKKIEEQVAKYLHVVVKKCCFDGAHRNDDESCEERAARITVGPKCVAAFKECCMIANKFRAEESHKNVQLGRLHTQALPVSKPEIRSYFPESWLWEVHRVSGRNQLQLTLPDSLTIWEIQGVGISNSGICVSDAVKAKVFKDVFLEMSIPYSVVRGEQIQLKGTVYNYRTSGMTFCVKMFPVEGICSSGSLVTDRQGRKATRCVSQRVEGSSSQLVTFTVLPLEIGLHNINFSLDSSLGREILVKTLRVVPEGVKKESHAGITLDPKGIYGAASTKKEFPYRVPLDLVPKTKVKRIVSVKGLLMGEVISAALSKEGIDILTHLPKGNAEAELMSIIPVFYVFHYLEAGNNWNIFYPDSLTKKENLEKKLKEGMVSIMSYRNADYSYSMWKDGPANTWFTAFALRVMGQVHRYVPQNQNTICNSLMWLVEQCQLENGSFKEKSHYQPLKLRTTLSTEAQETALYLTAFTVIGIRKAFDICPLLKISTALTKADTFLLENTLSTQSTFTLAIAAYALSLGDKSHPQFRSIVLSLRRKATVKGSASIPSYRFWKDDLQQKDRFAPNTGTAHMVETTAYALLTFLNLKDMNYVNPIIKWLSEQQRYGGGFYSTQDTINAIEGLTEYSLLIKHLHLNMDINLYYKNKGDFYHYKITEKNYLGRPIEVPLNDDLVVSTGFSSGLATVHVTTVLHKISTSEEVCHFNLKIEAQDIEASIHRGYSDSDYKRIVACASYKPSIGESSSGSSHAVMDISLPTGINASPDDLKALVEGVDQLLTDYQIKDGHVIVQLNSIPSNEFLCVRFRIVELFEVGFLSPATFRVYEYHRPEKQCIMFYSTSHSTLQKVCEERTCTCLEADCGQIQTELDLTISADTRKKTACEPEITYAYKVVITSITEENVFVKYTATLLDVYKVGDAVAEKDSEITFIKKMTCANADLQKGRQYLIMGKEALQIKHNFSFKYIYPLDSSTWIEYWPTDTTCSSCEKFLANLDEFAEDIFLNGCESG